jgi:hypothetical protein
LPSRTERYRVAAWSFVGVLIVAAAIPAYLTVPAEWRSFALRATCAAAVAMLGRRVIVSMRARVAETAPSILDTPAPSPREPQLDERFTRLRDDLRFSVQSRHYFDTFLIPRLRRLGGDGLAMPSSRGRRGPALPGLARTIADLEQRG